MTDSYFTQSAQSAQSEHFERAKPVWLDGLEHEMNVTAGFRAIVEPDGEEPMLLRLTASSLYRVHVCGTFIGHGPARGPHGYYRVDQWDLTDALKPGRNVIAIEVAGYNANGYYVLNQPSFLQAELQSGSRIIAYTSADNGHFTPFRLDERIQKVQRYSFQRTFIEYYRLKANTRDWITAADAPVAAGPCSEAAPKALLPRGVSYPAFELRNPAAVVAEGRFEAGYPPESYWRNRSLVSVGSGLAGYRIDELELLVSDELQETRTVERRELSERYEAAETRILQEGRFAILDFGLNLTGFVGVRLTVKKPAKLYITFDEILSGQGDVDFLRLVCVNAIGYELEPGQYDLESMEPYTLRYAKLMVMRGEVAVEAVSLREYINPDTETASFRCDREPLNEIFAAGVETFKQNAVDLYMDCPSRERAGWLCDSFFTSRAEYVLTGAAAVETNFLQNYLLPQRFAHLPDGVLPMCYPADHDDGRFIPNWMLWFVLELEEYAGRTGDRKLVMQAKEKTDRLFNYFRTFRNEDGLLENLQGWIFVEWSKANELVQGVNYPTNMLYAGALSAAGRLYGDGDLLAQAEQVRAKIRDQAFDGTFFIDQAIRQVGKLVQNRETTEVCQYYAFMFGIADPVSHPKLWDLLVRSFGPSRQKENLFPHVYPANAFIGNYLRLELLSRYGLGRNVLEQMEGYFHYMAAKTGTLWEHMSERASCNHGFASHVVHWLYRNALGVRTLDHATRRLELQFDPSFLSRCEGSLPAGGGTIRIEWRKEADTLYYSVAGTNGYEVHIFPVAGYCLREETT
ncbi:family 78 glycoside hydrolase catalytic domain [Paenibacillus beijingensis]|uniref:Alpha-L-rhamnosidase six-hairpin glycosidase domain-containing protein n=1 Tax=Paenibacillus beijingensis TaxID=1126833 RepID=A0A0D5NG76_9BACL|nr:family 78 glycoside hydrolase catalytic domain [Paenibacillus beijingensis]AJY74261.1 hypothetical protein VN24_06300 [Paenibacillus beijingensis]